MLNVISSLILIPAALVLASFGVHLLVYVSNNPDLDITVLQDVPIFGNIFAWKVVGGVLAWALFFLWIPYRTYSGPSTSFGYIPVYKVFDYIGIYDMK